MKWGMGDNSFKNQEPETKTKFCFNEKSSQLCKE